MVIKSIENIPSISLKVNELSKIKNQIIKLMKEEKFKSFVSSFYFSNFYLLNYFNFKINKK